MHWEVLIVPGIAIAVWILTTIFRGTEEAQKARQRPNRFDEAPQRRRPATNLDRSMEEARRRREPSAQRPAPKRAEPKRPIVLEEVKEPAPQTSLQSTRADYAPTQSPSRQPAAKAIPAPTPTQVQPSSPQTSLESTRAGYAPTQSPGSQPTAKELAAAPTILQVRQLLRSPKSAATAFVLREIFDAPRCRRQSNS